VTLPPPAPHGASWALVPAKGFARAKSRLGDVLSEQVRAAFARGLLEHVLAALRSVPGLAGVLVLTDDDEVEALALERGAHVLRDLPGAGLAELVDRGLQHVAARSAQAALVCMADLPRLTPVELEQVLEALWSSEVVLVPDAAEAGTNLLALRPPDRLASCFGRADSFLQHQARASSLGARVRVLRLPGVCFDVDGPADLEGLDDGDGSRES
jgi:2-phospho-L-lactate guanylyltransferase